eukprot:3935407-Rhodomonas_salina.5
MAYDVSDVLEENEGCRETQLDELFLRKLHLLRAIRAGAVAGVVDGQRVEHGLERRDHADVVGALLHRHVRVDLDLDDAS